MWTTCDKIENSPNTTMEMQMDDRVVKGAFKTQRPRYNVTDDIASPIPSSLLLERSIVVLPIHDMMVVLRGVRGRGSYI